MSGQRPTLQERERVSGHIPEEDLRPESARGRSSGGHPDGVQGSPGSTHTGPLTFTPMCSGSSCASAKASGELRPGPAGGGA